MRKDPLFTRKLIKSSVAVGAALAITVVQTIVPAQPAQQRKQSPASSSNECQVSQSFANSLEDFQTQSETLNSKSTVSSAELRRLQASATRLKDNVRQTVVALQASIRRQ